MGVSFRHLEECENRYHLIFPDDYKEYMRFSSGMDILGGRIGLWRVPENEDKESISDWKSIHKMNRPAVLRQRELFDAQARNALNNRYLVQKILLNWTTEEYREMLKAEPDFRNALTCIGDGKSTLALGVMGEMNSALND